MQPNVPRTPSFRSIRDLDYSNERSYNESKVSWKEDEENGGDEEADGKEADGNVAQSEDTSVLETFSDEEDGSLFGISTPNVLYQTEETKPRNEIAHDKNSGIVSDADNDTRSLGTVLGDANSIGTIESRIGTTLGVSTDTGNTGIMRNSFFKSMP